MNINGGVLTLFDEEELVAEDYTQPDGTLAKRYGLIVPPEVEFIRTAPAMSKEITKKVSFIVLPENFERLDAASWLNVFENLEEIRFHPQSRTKIMRITTYGQCRKLTSLDIPIGCEVYSNAFTDSNIKRIRIATESCLMSHLSVAKYGETLTVECKDKLYKFIAFRQSKTRTVAKIESEVVLPTGAVVYECCNHQGSFNPRKKRPTYFLCSIDESTLFRGDTLEDIVKGKGKKI